MKEILFKGKRKDNGEWVEGYVSQDTILDLNETYIALVIRPKTEKLFDDAWFEVIPETIGQYTGLTDKHGTKIFEGDVIKQIFYLKQPNVSLEREYRTVIEYGISYAYSDVCGVCQRFSDGSGIAMLSVMDKSGVVDCEIIGNIHDNPGLMKREMGVEL